MAAKSFAYIKAGAKPKPSSQSSGKLQVAASKSWLYQPSLDLIIGCGAWSAPLLLLAYLLGKESDKTASLLFYALALVFNYPHYAATIHRAYRHRQDFTKYKFFTWHLTILLLLAAIVTHALPSLVPFVFTVYITWSPWHYTGQNFGLAMMFARRNGAQPQKIERNALFASFVASYLILFLSFHGGASNDPYVLSLGLPESFVRFLKIPLILIFSASGLWSLHRLRKQTKWRAMLAPLTLFTTQFLWFVAPAILEMLNQSRLPQARYSTGILAIMHSAQYIWITSYFARQETQISEQKQWQPLAYAATLLVVGIALFIPAPWLVSYLFQYDFGTSFLIFTALVNIHHFLLDGTVWKLRDSQIAALLLSSKETISKANASQNWWLNGLALKIKNGKQLRRLTLAGVAVSLLMLAGIDQVRYFWGLQEKNAANLLRAAGLNPYDSSLKLKIARSEAKTGNEESTIASLRQAVALNPLNVEAQNSLARLLLERQRYDEAYAHYQQMCEHLPNDADALINFGILAEQSGNPEQAITSWRRAIAVDKQQKNAYLYVAEGYSKQQRPIDAIPYYEQYLGLLTALSEGEKLNPKDVLYLTYKLAQAYSATNAPERALPYYEKTILFAEQAGEKAIESLAFISLANLYAAANQRTVAAECYQRALKLDKEIGDTKTEGMNWYNYGQFLFASSTEKQLAMACLLKAEELLQSTQEVERDTVMKAIEDRKLSSQKEFATSKQNLQILSAKALSLKL